MRADECTLVTLDTVLGLPHGNEGTHTALLIGSGTGIPGTVLAALECAHGQQVAVLGVDGTNHVVNKLGSVVGSGAFDIEVAPSGIHSQLGVLVTTVNGLVVLVHHVLTLAAIGLDDELLHLLDGQVNGDNLGDAEECALQDGVGAVAQTNLLSDLGGVDVVNLDVVVGEVLLHVVGQVLGQLVGVPNGVQQEGTTLLQTAGHVIHVQVGLNVASHEVGRGHQVGRADGLVAEAQVRAGEATRLLAVVGEVSLAVLVGVVTDDLHTVLVGTHGTVSTQTVELGLEHAGATHGHLFLHGQRGEGHVVLDTDGELVLGHRQGQVLINRENLGGRGVLAAEAVAATHDNGGILGAVEAVLHVEIQGLAVSAGLLGAVEHGNALGSAGNGCEEVLGAEGAIQVNSDEADLLTLIGQIVDGLADGLGHTAHGDDDAVGILGAVVVKQTILAAGDLADLVHVVLDDGGNCGIVVVARLAVLEEYVGILGSTTGNGLVRIHRIATELGQLFHVDEGTQVFLVHGLYLLDLVRGAETVKEVDEGHMGLDGAQVGNTGEVHDLLDTALGEHGKTGLTGSHHILVVTEDTQGVASQRTGRNVEHAREQLTGDLVHVGDHQQQTLRRGVGRGQGTCLQRTVNGTGGATLALHLLDHYGLTKDVLAAGGGPLVHVLGHR